LAQIQQLIGPGGFVKNHLARERFGNGGYFLKRVCALGIAGLGLIGAGAAPAQTAAGTAGPAAAATAAPAADDQALEAIVVTGTLIRGAAPVGSTLIAVDQADLQATGGNDVINMLLDVPQVSPLGVSEAQRSGTGGAGNITLGNSINLRGISPFATLTLLDGHRVPAAGTSGSTVDPDSFPSIMLQKIDIVADGASATYGSDAIAGVANLILRRDVEGVEVSAREGWADEYQERKLGVLAGHSWDSGQITIGYENTYHSALQGPSRSFFQSDQTSRGGGDYRSMQCNPGNIVAGGTSYAIPPGGVTPANAGALVANTTNLCDIARYQDILPEIEHNNVALTFDQKVNDALSFYGDATYARRNFSNAVGTGGVGPYEVPSTNAYFVAPAGAALSPCSPAPGSPLCEQVDANFGSILGNQAVSYGHSENYQFTLGADYKFAGDWHFGVDGTEGRDHDRDLQNAELNNGNLATALASGNPATALNPFGGANSAAVVNNVYDSRFYAPGDSGEQVLEAKIDGPLFRLPGGDVRSAFGTQWRHDELYYGINTGVPLVADTIIRQQLDRVSKSAYAEFLIPIVGAGNAIPGIQKLDLDVAGRYEHYSDFGSTTHPKVGLNWTPIDDVVVHASYGTSFRAPLLSELVGPLHGVFVQQYADPQSPSGTSVGYTLGGGNTGLKPETATTYSFGIDYKPVEHADINLNYWGINYKNQISSYLSDLTILQQPAQLGSLINRCPSAACTSLINQYVGTLPVFGPILTNPSVFVNGLEENLGTTLTRGVDVQGSYAVPTDHIGTFTVGLTGTVTTKYEVQFVPGGASFNELNTIGYPLKLRTRGSLGWNIGALSAIVFVNFENSYTNTQVTPIETVSSYTTVDMNAVYDLGEAIPSVVTKNLKVTLHIDNMFDRDPPYVNIPISANGGGGFDPGAANPIDRLISVALSKKF
jgi:iron complex outermembrane receptor protein